jgi:glycosyltransferase involved in cell wall biosynthesis
MTSRVKVSVIIPTFQRPKLLEMSLSNLCLQTLKEFEVLVIDDSTGGDKDTLSVSQKDWPINVKYIKNNRNKGANGARNTGIIASTGQYIAFHDDDDKWFPNKLEKQYNCLKHRDKKWGAAYCGYEMVMPDGTTIPVAAKKEGDLRPLVLMGKVNLCAGSTLMVDRKIIDQIGLLDEKLLRYQDLEYVIRINRYCRIAAINENLARIEKHEPPSGRSVVLAKHQFLNLIQKDINKLAKKERKYCYAVHFNEISLAYARAGFRKKSLIYLHKAMKNCMLLPSRYFTTFIYLISGSKKNYLLTKFLLVKSLIKKNLT